MMNPEKAEKAQLVAALVLTIGEYATAVWFLVAHGDFVFLFLTITYYVRETKGGSRYHEAVDGMLVTMFKRISKKGVQS